ncbi:M3 family metallopeptidase [Stackebrandtia nassauensis]|uniref:M3 family metallopeptidase n=1 Tax=Stackebrandtia nassauensis TaxID=283811 RepID=UPI0011853E1B|nr:M3 family metallopeptidase [Stackebrandtia nassauensis]
MTDENPFTAPSTLPYQLPPLADITDADYLPGFEIGMAEQRTEVEAIAAATEPPTFDNTVVALERTGGTLRRVAKVFFNKAAADTNERVREVQSRVAPLLSAHRDAITLDERLFARVAAVYDALDDSDLDDESRWLTRRYHLDFVRAGAKLSATDKERLRALNEELSSLETLFAQNQLAATNAAAVIVDDAERLDGLSQGSIETAASAAADRGLSGKYLLTLNNHTVPSQLESLTDAELRRELYQASIARGNDGAAHDNSATLLRIVRLRAERARLLGYDNHAAYIIEDQTADSATVVAERLAKLAAAAVANVRVEAAERAEVLGQDSLEPQDWALATEQLRAKHYDLDGEAMRPYLELDSVLTNGVFHAANQLYGITFTERFDLPVYHPDVRVFEVFDADSTPLGLFLADFYSRDSKNGGAWMNCLVDQSRLFDQRPVVVNNLNIPKPPPGTKTLLTFTEVTTMFHEFGHALHGLFSDVHYPRFTGTTVPRDFVEYPSQVNEMWSLWPRVLANYARHHETGEVMPDKLREKLVASQGFNEGFKTTEYLAAALLDQAWHRLSLDEVPDDADPRATVERFEAEALAAAGINVPEVRPRYRSTYFGHIFAGGYSAGYYSYIWSEILDADTVEWFKDNGGLERDNGDRFRQRLLAKGGSVDPMAAFRDFAGRDPRIEPLLTRRGLDAAN